AGWNSSSASPDLPSWCSTRRLRRSRASADGCWDASGTTPRATDGDRRGVMSYVLTQAATWPRLAGLGQPAPPLSPGASGLAMSRVGGPADAVRLLRLSSTFRNMASVLDNAYVDHLTWQELRRRFPALSLTPALRI